jgi:hypothetical protein
MQSRPEPEIGKQYTYDEVGDFYEHDASDLDWVLFRGRYIVALRLREEFNPDIAAFAMLVYVSADSPSKEWGNTLANDTPYVPVFVKKTNSTVFYTYYGLFKIANDYTSKYNCNWAAAQVPHDRGISRLVFLLKLEP